MENSGIITTKPLSFIWDTKDPFLFCAYHLDKYPEGNGNFGPKSSLVGRNIGQDFEGKDGWRMYHGENIPGFPAHPHRGFETVTLVQKGFVDHSDSIGATARYGMGDVQWMTAGKGIQHAEMFPLINENKENTLELFQIWLNLPAKNKMVDPFYKMFWSEKIPQLLFKDTNYRETKVKLVAGNLDSHLSLEPPPNSWASSPENHVAIWIIEMEPFSEWVLPASIANLSKTLYFYEGSRIYLDNRELPVMYLVDLVSDKKILIRNHEQTAKLLLLQGKPIQERIVQYGPFVMNTEEEIQQAFYDYQRTRFGGWPWNSVEPVHGKMRRFSKYADGKEEVPFL